MSCIADIFDQVDNKGCKNAEKITTIFPNFESLLFAQVKSKGYENLFMITQYYAKLYNLCAKVASCAIFTKKSEMLGGATWAVVFPLYSLCMLVEGKIACLSPFW